MFVEGGFSLEQGGVPERLRLYPKAADGFAITPEAKGHYRND